eukprot:gene12129-12267_t
MQRPAAAADGDRKQTSKQTPAQYAEAKARSFLSQNTPTIEYKTGVAGNLPSVTHPFYRKPGDLLCPCCERPAVLQGNGIRQGTRCSLSLTGQEKVFSYGMVCKKCPGNSQKDYTFSTWNVKWMELNFSPALFEAMPWILLPGNSIADRSLVNHIVRMRSQGLSFEVISSSRNEEVASRATKEAILHLHTLLARTRTQQAAQRLFAGAGASNAGAMAGGNNTGRTVAGQDKVADMTAKQLQAKMMAEEPVDGHLSLDHVHETAKRMAGGYTGMLIAMGASGLVTGYWNVFSTSLKDVEKQLQQLDQNQRVKHGQGIKYVTVDNPHTVENLLKKVLPGVQVKMDAGHVLFSRLGKRLSKKHVKAGAATKDLAMCLFDFNKDDLSRACAVIRKQKKEYWCKSDQALVKLLPLSTFKRTVRRVYLPPEQQAERLEQWYATYIEDLTVFVDTSVAGQARPLIRGGAEGLKEFKKVFQSQLQLVFKGMLSDPPGVEMYVEVGKTKSGLTLWRCTRGSAKNEAANLVAERSLHTTAKMNELTATGILSDRFARFNHDVKLTLHKAQLRLNGDAGDSVRNFDHSMDFVGQLRVNSLCQQLGVPLPYCFLDPTVLGGPEQPAGAPSEPGGELQLQSQAQEQEQQDAAGDLGLDLADVSRLRADWDEDVLSDDSDEEGHKQNCKYCKCDECKKAFSKRGTLDPKTFLLKEKCVLSGIKKKK